MSKYKGQVFFTGLDYPSPFIFTYKTNTSGYTFSIKVDYECWTWSKWTHDDTPNGDELLIGGKCLTQW